MSEFFFAFCGFVIGFVVGGWIEARDLKHRERVAKLMRDGSV
jgi:hypothetical protein